MDGSRFVGGAGRGPYTAAMQPPFASGLAGMTRRFARAAGAIALMGGVLCGIGGCQSDGGAARDDVAMGASDPLGAIPRDLTIDVLIVSGDGWNDAADEPVTRRSGRFVVFPDGSLHYGEGRAFIDELPPEVRVLSRADLAELWSLADQLGWADPDAGEPPTGLDPRQWSGAETVYRMDIRAAGRRWQFERVLVEPGARDAAAEALVRALAVLAWVEEGPVLPPSIMPQRYDLGPDPYERYRR